MTSRSNKIDLAALLQQPNPVIDLRTNIYEHSTRNFLKALTGWKNRAMHHVAERRKVVAAEKKKLQEKIHYVESETNQCKLREIALVAGA
mgnify:CR=1 FL=1